MISTAVRPVVVFDCMCPNARGALTGNFVHARELAAALDRRADLELILLVDQFTQPVMEELGLRARLFPCQIAAKGKIADQLAVSWAIDRLKPDLYHKPTGPLPLTYLSCPAIATIADLNFKRLPTKTAARIYKEIAYRRTLQRAAALICISEFTRDELRRFFGEAADRSIVIHHGPTDFPSPDDSLARGLPAPFFLTFGQHAHKNVETCLRALASAAAEAPAGAGPALVVAGAGAHVAAKLQPLSRELGLGERVIFVGRVSDAALHGLYRRAAGLLFMSHYEGFGLPLLEAMRAECPVVASEVCSHREVAGDAALFCAPDDVAALAAAMRALAHDAALRAELAARGRERAALFSWDRAADETARIYRHALAAVS